VRFTNVLTTTTTTIDSFAFMCLYFVFFFHDAYLSYPYNTVGWVDLVGLKPNV